MPFWYTWMQWQLQFPKNMVNRSDITWQNIRESLAPNKHIKYCPGWDAPKKKGHPKNEKQKLGIVAHVQWGIAKRRCRNNTLIVPDKIIEEVNEDNAAIAKFDKVKLEDTKDGVLGSA